MWLGEDRAPCIVPSCEKRLSQYQPAAAVSKKQPKFGCLVRPTDFNTYFLNISVQVPNTNSKLFAMVNFQ